ncbi:MAG: NAD-dependent epimerase/dehydratase family protein, partial [Pseudomonadota bacterium]
RNSRRGVPVPQIVTSGNNFHAENSHVLPALMRRFHEASAADLPEVTIWGTGTPRREFLHVDDMAAASLFVLDLPKEVYKSATEPMLSHINVGSGTDIAILELAKMIAQVVGYTGKISTDPNKPDGTPRKLMDVTRLMNLGWQAQIHLEKGIRDTYTWFCQSLLQADSIREK